MEFDFSYIAERFERLKDEQPRLLHLAAGIVKDDVIARTLSGTGVNEESLSEYTPRYQRKKENAGKYSGVTDLYWTGGMLSDIRALEMGDGLEVYFSDAYVAIAQGNQERWNRNFFGVNEKTVESVTEGLLPRVQQILHGNS